MRRICECKFPSGVRRLQAYAPLGRAARRVGVTRAGNAELPSERVEKRPVTSFWDLTAGLRKSLSHTGVLTQAGSADLSWNEWEQLAPAANSKELSRPAMTKTVRTHRRPGTT